MLILGVVDGGVWHVGVTVSWLLGRRRRRLAHAAEVLSRARSRSDLRLRRVGALHVVPGVLGKWHPVDGRRSRGLVLPHVRERRMSLELRRHHLGLHGFPLGRRAVLVIVVVVIVAAVEVSWAFVLARATMLRKN